MARISIISCALACCVSFLVGHSFGIDFRTISPEDQGCGWRDSRPSKSKNLTVVVYSGPTNTHSVKGTLYDENFRFFLRHGLPCSYSYYSNQINRQLSSTFRFVFALTKETKHQYEDYIRALNQSACGLNDLHIIVREDKFYDMESGRVAFREHFGLLESSDYVVFLNCGLCGPFIQRKANGTIANPFWATTFTDRMTESVKLSGLSMNCAGKLNVHHAHVQSMLWATDRDGLEVILGSDTFYDCGNQLSQPLGREKLIVQYELGISRAILKAGYGIVSNLDIQPDTFVWHNATRNGTTPPWCTDLWSNQCLARYVGESLIFYKVSREFPRSVKDHATWMDTLLNMGNPT